MPIHDWTRVEAGLFHAFHQYWITFLCQALSTSLPSDYIVIAEQSIQGPIPDVLTLRVGADEEPVTDDGPRGVAVAIAPPRARIVQTTEASIYARKADRVVVKHRRGRTVAVIEIVSPGNKGSTAALRTFVEKTSGLIEQGVNVLVVDLFPPSRRDPQGLHKAIWDEFEDAEFALPVDKSLTLVSYDAGLMKTAYVEPVAVGDVLPEMPLFLSSELYVPVPLEVSYQMAWSIFPPPFKALLGPGHDD